VLHPIERFDDLEAQFAEFLRHCLGIPLGMIKLSGQRILLIADADDQRDPLVGRHLPGR
jgi:hypothetical protein